MKYILKAQRGFGKQVLERITTAQDLFDQMVSMDMLNINNMLYIQSLMWHTGRKDLHAKIVEFCKDLNSRPLHFFAPDKTPVNGYKYLEFHVKGALETTTREEVEHLRSLVARLTCVPPEFVNLSGITPFKSLVITFMLPEDVLGTLMHLSDKEKSLLQDMRIDFFAVDGHKVMISEIVFEKPDTLSEVDEVKKIMNENNQLERQLDNTQADLFEKGKELKTSLRKVSSMKAEIDRLERECSQIKQEKEEVIAYFVAPYLSKSQPKGIEEGSISKSNAFTNFKHAFMKFRQEFPECTDSICYLLEANTVFVKVLERDLWKTYMERLKAAYKYMEYENKKAVYYLTGKSDNYGGTDRKFDEVSSSADRDEKPYASKVGVMPSENSPQQGSRRQRLFHKTTPKVETGQKVPAELSVTPPTPDNDPHYSALENISKILDSEQKTKLLGNLPFNKVEAGELKKYPNKFLILLLKKENKPWLPHFPDIKKTVMKKLTKLNNGKLSQRAEELFENARKEFEACKSKPKQDKLMSSAIYSRGGPPPEWKFDKIDSARNEDTPRGIHSSKSDPSFQEHHKNKCPDDVKQVQQSKRHPQMDEISSRLENIEHKMSSLMDILKNPPYLVKDPFASSIFASLSHNLDV